VFLAEDGVLYLAVTKKFYAIDRESGGMIQLNEKQVADLSSRRTEKVSYVPGRDKDFLARNVMTGEEIWRFKTDRSCSGAALMGGAALFTCYDGKLYAVDAQTGDFKWSLTTKAPQPTVITEDGVIYCTIGDGRLYAIK
jgi:outer membrane protein assembly factor BamB